MIQYTKDEVVELFNKAIGSLKRKYKTFNSDAVLYELIFIMDEKEKDAKLTLEKASVFRQSTYHS